MCVTNMLMKTYRQEAEKSMWLVSLAMGSAHDAIVFCLGGCPDWRDCG